MGNASEETTDRPRSRKRTPAVAADSARGVYGISVAAELSGIGTQALRLYEAKGLVEPGRTAGGTRRYSADDIERLRRISELIDAGVNLTGIGLMLDLQDANEALASENERLADALQSEQPERPTGNEVIR